MNKEILYKSSEREKKKGFGVRLEKCSLIYAAVDKNICGSLGRIELGGPVKDASVDLSSNPEYFSLTAKINTGTYLNLFPNQRLHTSRGQIFDALKESSPNSRQGEGQMIITGPEGTNFLIGSIIGGYDGISISTVTVEGFNTNEEKVSSGLEKNQQNLEKALKDMAQVTESSVNKVYKLVGQNAPQKELVLGPMSLQSEKEAKQELTKEIEERDQLLNILEIKEPGVSFEDIGGQEEAKEVLKKVAMALENPENFRKWGTEAPKGVLLYGPPGTGKTLAAKALSSEANARFLHIEASSVTSKYYGDSEKKLKTIFDLAKESNEKMILYFDEIDALTPKRQGAHEETARTIAVFLENMDGIEKNDNILVVASTNRREDIDPALRRSGRFDRQVEMGMPDEKARGQIFGIQIRKAEEKAGRSLFFPLDLDLILKNTENLNGADIREIIRRTLEEKACEETRTGNEPGPVVTSEIMEQVVNFEKLKKEKKGELGIPIYY